MRREKLRVAALFITAALTVPIGAMALTPQDDNHEKHERDEHRIYDTERKDYHNWDATEDGAYRHWLDGRHETYVEYARLDKKRQKEYWKWRHEHDEHDRH
jgi:hypothetical protein